ncbi:hypothetical protein ACVGWT_01080, partial [Enterobacter hormaechei]
HIASEPLAPGRVGPVVTATLSPNILKLVENNNEHRYQNLARLICDLRRCQATLNPEGEIVDFFTGHQDLSLIHN